VKSLLEGGGVVNVDSGEELAEIRRMAEGRKGAPCKLGLRCNFDVQDGVLSRLGFDVGGKSFAEAIALIDADPSLELVGLQCHFATRSLSCWENRTKGMIAVIDRFFRDRVENFQYVSLGGGLYGHMPEEMKAQFPVAIPDFADYAAAAAMPFAEFFDRLGTKRRPALIVEPGTALVADAMKFVCTVKSIKDVRGHAIVTLSGSTYNINPTPNRKNVPLAVFSAAEDENKTLVEGAYFGGYTCIEGDYLYKGYTGRLAVGDYVVFDDVGSYSVVMKPPFILPNVAIVEPDAEGRSHRLIKRRETFEDVFQTYAFAGRSAPLYPCRRPKPRLAQAGGAAPPFPTLTGMSPRVAIRLLYITKDPFIGQIAERAGVDWVFVDLEYRGKHLRQVGRDTVISAHAVEDVAVMRRALTRSRLLVRINPLGEWSEREIEKAIAAGADALMLPFFKTEAEAARFVQLVGGRVEAWLLLETMDSIRAVDDILAVPGVDYIHVGLNDLHIERKTRFMFEFLADGSMDALADKIRARGIAFGFGGMARIGELIPPAEHILAEHYRLGSSGVILSRSFCRPPQGDHLEELARHFTEGVRAVRATETDLAGQDKAFFERNRLQVGVEVQQVVDAISAKS
jgi:diaminopimelate decarboxylase